MTIYALELLNQVRNRLSDTTTEDPEGSYVYAWQESDVDLKWTNLELMDYFQNVLRDIGVEEPIKDDTDTTYTQIALVSGTNAYPVNSLIESIEEAWLSSDGRPLAKVTAAELTRQQFAFDRQSPYYSGTDWRDETVATSNTPTHYIQDLRQGYIRVYPQPTAADTLKMTVKRRFVDETIAWSDISAEAALTQTLTEVPDTLKSCLIYGMCAKAFEKWASETAQSNLSDYYEKRFTDELANWRKRINRLENADLRLQVLPHPYTRKTRYSRGYRDRVGSSLW